MGAIGLGKRGMLVELILFGESSLRRAVTAFVEHYHGERNHQGKKMFCFFQQLNNGWVAAMAKCAARSDWAAS